MAKLSAQQIASLALNAGVPKDQVAKAVAIALAESGGDTNAHNATPPDDSYGLWQINMLGSLGPSRRRQFGLSSNSELFNPAVNARAMHAISNGGRSWTAWTTYTRGTYLRHMSEANRAAGDPVTVQTGLPGLPDGNTFENIIDAIKRLQQPGFWTRLVYFVAGMVLLLLGIARLTGDNQLSPLTKKAAAAIVFRKVSK